MFSFTTIVSVKTIFYSDMKWFQYVEREREREREREIERERNNKEKWIEKGGGPYVPPCTVLAERDRERE